MLQYAIPYLWDARFLLQREQASRVYYAGVYPVFAKLILFSNILILIIFMKKEA